MANIDAGRPFTADDRHRSEQRQAMLLFCIAYPFCLIFTLGARLVPRAGVGPRVSVFRESNAAAWSFIPFVFR